MPRIPDSARHLLPLDQLLPEDMPDPLPAVGTQIDFDGVA